MTAKRTISNLIFCLIFVGLYTEGGNKPVVPRFDTLLCDIIQEHEGSELELVEKLAVAVKKGAQLDGINEIGWTALHLAAAYGYLEVVKFLIKKGADINSVNEDGQAALQIAVDEGYFDIVIFLVENGAHLLPDRGGAFDLFGVYLEPYEESEQRKYTDWCLEVAKKVHKKNSKGDTPLHTAVMFEGTVPMVAYLLAKGADVNQVNNSGYTPLLYASARGKRKCIAFLLGNGAAIDSVDNFGNTVLHLMGNCRQMKEKTKRKLFHLFIEKGAKIDEKNNRGNTPLHSAAQRGDLVMIKLLIEKGAKIDEKNKQGETALHCAVRYGDLDSVRFLVEKGAEINERTLTGETSLHYAVQFAGSRALLKFLENGAKINVEECIIPYEATERGNLETVIFLLGNGASFYIKNRQGLTALDIAKNEKCENMVSYLTFIADFYRVVNNQMPFKTFAGQYGVVGDKGCGLKWGKKQSCLEQAVQFALLSCGSSKFIREFYSWDKVKLYKILMKYNPKLDSIMKKGSEDSIEGAIKTSSAVSEFSYSDKFDLYRYLLGLAMRTDSFLLAQDVLTESPELRTWVVDKKTFKNSWKLADKKMFKEPLIKFMKIRHVLLGAWPAEVVDRVLRFLPLHLRVSTTYDRLFPLHQNYFVPGPSHEPLIICQK